MSTKTAVFWAVEPVVWKKCTTESEEEAVRTSETLVNFYQNTRRYNPEDSNLSSVISALQDVKNLQNKKQNKNAKVWSIPLVEFQKHTQNTCFQY
jgi:hypothetical protein